MAGIPPTNADETAEPNAAGPTWHADSWGHSRPDGRVGPRSGHRRSGSPRS